jgi:hypothetical protein
MFIPVKEGGESPSKGEFSMKLRRGANVCQHRALSVLHQSCKQGLKKHKSIRTARIDYYMYLGIVCGLLYESGDYYMSLG